MYIEESLPMVGLSINRFKDCAWSMKAPRSADVPTRIVGLTARITSARVIRAWSTASQRATSARVLAYGRWKSRTPGVSSTIRP